MSAPDGQPRGMRRWLRGDLAALADQRGTVLLFTVVVLVTLLAMAGFATDMAYMMAAKTELQRSLDAGALAGDGRLGFDGTVFNTVRASAQSFALMNKYRNPSSPNVTLDLNTANAATGHIVIGNWAGGLFTPSTSITGPSPVNAVQCRWNTTVPTAFLRVLGINQLAVSAKSVAVGSLFPQTLSGQCVFPVGISSCSASGSPCGVFTVIRLPSGPANQPGTNVGALISTNPPEALQTSQLLNALNFSYRAQLGACGDFEPLRPTSNPQTSLSAASFQPAMDDLEFKFRDRFTNTANTYVVRGANDNVVYQGKGWQVYLPILEYSDCDSGLPMNGNRQVKAFTQFIITQVIHNISGGSRCTVNNPADANSWGPYCNSSTNPLGGPGASWEVIMGYTACGIGTEIAQPMTRRLVN